MVSHAPPSLGRCYVRTGNEHALPRQFWQHAHDGLAAGACELELHEVGGVRTELCRGEEACGQGYEVNVLLAEPTVFNSVSSSYKLLRSIYVRLACGVH